MSKIINRFQVVLQAIADARAIPESNWWEGYLASRSDTLPTPSPRTVAREATARAIDGMSQEARRAWVEIKRAAAGMTSPGYGLGGVV